MGDGYRWWTFKTWCGFYGTGLKAGPVTVCLFRFGRTRYAYLSVLGHLVYDGVLRAAQKGKT